MDELLFEDEITEEHRTRRRLILARLRKSLWTLLVLSGLLGLLLPLTAYLHWWSTPLACLLGLLTGVSIEAGFSTSQQNRALISAVLGVLILPGIAVYLSHLAASDREAAEAASAVITPFIVHALAGFAGGAIIASIWRSRAEADIAGAAQRTGSGPATKEPPVSGAAADLRKEDER